MEIKKKSIKGSPYIGVFCSITEDYGLFPKTCSKKELEEFGEALDIEPIPANIANSSLLGIFARGKNNKFVLPKFSEEREIRELEEAGLDILVLPGKTSFGNLLTLNDNAGIASQLLSKHIVEELEKFFQVKFYQKEVANSDVPGSAMTLTNKGFILNSNASQLELKELKKTFKVYGTLTTANYGDVFVGNSVVANSKAAIVGSQTSGHELIRIDEGLRGE